MSPMPATEENDRPSPAAVRAAVAAYASVSLVTTTPRSSSSATYCSSGVSVGSSEEIRSAPPYQTPSAFFGLRYPAERRLPARMSKSAPCATFITMVAPWRPWA